jgi:hypothetical protein
MLGETAPAPLILDYAALFGLTQVLARLAQAGRDVLRTDQHGAITLKRTGRSCS